MAGKQTKAKKGGRNQDKETGMLALTVLIITSFSATNAYMCSIDVKCHSNLQIAIL